MQAKRTYGVPNVLECACSMVITDPKSEILRKTGNLLKQKGYEGLSYSTSALPPRSVTTRLCMYMMTVKC